VRPVLGYLDLLNADEVAELVGDREGKAGDKHPAGG
jgi:hypothetical protein